jgi:PPM family protein phosphatase
MITDTSFQSNHPPSGRQGGFSIFAAATRGNKPVNEDACVCFQNETAGFQALIVADGLGSYGYAAEASAFAVSWMQHKLMQLDDAGAIDFEAFFPLLKHSLIEYVEEFEADNQTLLDRFANFGTTLLCAVETPDYQLIAYVGNGAIWHIKANFNEFSPARLLPWNAVNYLNPHSVEEGGREALYRLLSPSDNFDEITPTVLRLNKDTDFGDILMLCTDGIYSQDQLRMGKNSTGIWLKIEQSLLDFYAGLSEYFTTIQQQPVENQTVVTEISDEALPPEPGILAETQLLEQFLQNYLQKGTWDDDATIAVLITPEALRYQTGRF